MSFAACRTIVLQTFSWNRLHGSKRMMYQFFGDLVRMPRLQHKHTNRVKENVEIKIKRESHFNCSNFKSPVRGGVPFFSTIIYMVWRFFIKPKLQANRTLTQQRLTLFPHLLLVHGSNRRWIPPINAISLPRQQRFACPFFPPPLLTAPVYTGKGGRGSRCCGCCMCLWW